MKNLPFSTHRTRLYKHYKKQQPCITHYFVFIALPSVSFVMTAAKSPHYSALSSLHSITTTFTFCTHPFTHALLHWQMPKFHLSFDASIYSCLPSIRTRLTSVCHIPPQHEYESASSISTLFQLQHFPLCFLSSSHPAHVT